MNKKVFLLLIMILLSGCTVKNEITITDKKEVYENIEVSIYNSNLDMYGFTSSKEFLDYYYNQYTSLPAYSSYKIKKQSTKSKSIFKASKKYDDIASYTKGYSFLNIYNSASISENGSYLTFKTSENYYLKALKDPEAPGHSFEGREYKINIKFYNEVIESNATSYDNITNTYTWVINDSTNVEDSFIYFKTGPKVLIRVKILDYISKNLLTIILVISFILICLIAILYIRFLAKKNNEI